MLFGFFVKLVSVLGIDQSVCTVIGVVAHFDHIHLLAFGAEHHIGAPASGAMDTIPGTQLVAVGTKTCPAVAVTFGNFVFNCF